MTIEQEMKVLIRRVDSAFQEGRFSEVADEMGVLDVDTMDPNLVVGWLSFTYPARRQLGDARVAYVARAKVRLEATIGPDRTANILSRLG